MCASSRVGTSGKRCVHFNVTAVNTLTPRQNGRHFADDIFKWIFLNENVWIPIKMSLKFVPQGPINNIPALVQIMAWRRPGDKPLSEPIVIRLPTHICVTRPQRINSFSRKISLEVASELFRPILGWVHNNNPALVCSMACCQTFEEPLYKPSIA